MKAILFAVVLVMAPGAVLARPASAQDPEMPVADTVEADAFDTAEVSPASAFVRSLVLPGWGHASIGAPGRGGVYFALEGGSLWMLYTAQRRLREARAEESWLRALGALGPEEQSPLVRDRLRHREDWIALSLFWLFFSGADAFVMAHLADFDRQVGVMPAEGGGLRFEASVPLRRAP